MDSTAQIIVAPAVTHEANDKQQLQPMLEKVKENCGRLPAQVSADAGYFNTQHLTDETLSTVDLHVPPDRQKHSAAPEASAATTAATGDWAFWPPRQCARAFLKRQSRTTANAICNCSMRDGSR